jgi:hypothetical protein
MAGYLLPWDSLSATKVKGVSRLERAFIQLVVPEGTIVRSYAI